MSRHSILVGDPPSFQGAERDIVFLSMVCSRGAVPTQNQLLHAQRANVALSRARDRCVLVRSIGLNDIPSIDDIKVPIIEFFQTNSTRAAEQSLVETMGVGLSRNKESCRLMKSSLDKLGYRVSGMGGVWRDALCVEDVSSDERVAVLVDCDSESEQEWERGYSQQLAIERVGWRCLRVDMLSFVYDHAGTMKYIKGFLDEAGIQVLEMSAALENVPDDADEAAPALAEGVGVDVQPAILNDDVPIAAHDDTAFISGDDLSSVSSVGAAVRSDVDADQISAARFGQVVDLSFLGKSVPAQKTRRKSDPSYESSAPNKDQKAGASQQKRSTRARKKDDVSLGIQVAGDESEEASFRDESSRDADSDFDE